MNPIEEEISDTCGAGSTVAAGHKRRDLMELCFGYGLILLTIWTPHPWQKLFYLASLVCVLLITLGSLDGWSTMGFRPAGSLRTLWVVAAALVLAALAVIVAVRLHTLHLPLYPSTLVKRYWGYVVWAFLQEFVLLNFVLLRLVRLMPDRISAVFATAGLFALAHLPNPILTPVTLIWGFIACLLFLQYRNLYTLGLCHAICGICIAITVPGPVDHNMRVGIGYLAYGPHEHRHRSQKDHIVSTKAWVTAAAPIRRS